MAIHAVRRREIVLMVESSNALWFITINIPQLGRVVKYFAGKYCVITLYISMYCTSSP